MLWSRSFSLSIARISPVILLPILASVIACAGLPTVAQAGRMDDAFVNAFGRTPSTSFISGLVCMAEQPNVHGMQKRIATLGLSSRWRQHQYVVTNAQQLAAESQVGLLEALETWKQQGLVRSYQSYWVTNMIVIEAQPIVFDRLEARADVGTIYANAPVTIRQASPDGQQMDPPRWTLPDNLVCVNVQPAWSMGLHGDGSIVCDFDTGADATHPALATRWRGAHAGVPWYAAWHDPYHQTQFPSDAGVHGTHTLGIMVARQPNGTPIGVAPDAQWIAAGILIGYDVGKIIESYQWATDPDGDPNTVDDVPDVINNSWGTSDACNETFWNAIDVVEAAGIVNIIAVDNSGPDYASVHSPESRAETPTVNFGVGNVDPHTAGYPIVRSSGRGPSPCDFVSIKPEVTAPGTMIYSTVPGGGYEGMSGTSMAAPHVSGAVAILRQLNPDLSVDEIKTALMATAVDKGIAGEDNTYGWGIIDIGAAVSYVRQTLPLYPPQNLTTSVRGDTATLAWQRPAHTSPFDRLMSYRIYRAGRDESFPTTPIGEVPAYAPLLLYNDLHVPSGYYRYVVTAAYETGESGPSNEAIAIVNLPADAPVLVDGGIAAGAVLNVAPNPFNPVTVIRYRAPESGNMSIRIYDATGALVKSLADAPAASTSLHPVQSIVWDGTDGNGRAMPSGPYFVRFEANGISAVKRIVLLK